MVADKDPAIDTTQNNIRRQENTKKPYKVCYIIQILFVNLLTYVVANERALLLYIAWKIVNKVTIRNRKAIFGL
jgi:hypothetical protein